MDTFPKGLPARQKIQKKIANAKKFKNNKKKKQMKCKKILAKVNKLFKSIEEKMDRKAVAKCKTRIKEGEDELVGINIQAFNYFRWESNIAEAREFNAIGKYRECVQMMTKTIKQITNAQN